jgi:hypothetical protein
MSKTVINIITAAETVDSVLSKHKNLDHLRDILISDIETLNEDLIQEQAVEAALLLLSAYTSIELKEEKALQTTPTDSPFPRSIRLNTVLTCSEKGTRETEAFLSLKEKADVAKLAYQQKMRQLIVQTIKLDVETKKKELRDIFFSSFSHH